MKSLSFLENSRQPTHNKLGPDSSQQKEAADFVPKVVYITEPDTDEGEPDVERARARARESKHMEWQDI